MAQNSSAIILPSVGIMRQTPAAPHLGEEFDDPDAGVLPVGLGCVSENRDPMRSNARYETLESLLSGAHSGLGFCVWFNVVERRTRTAYCGPADGRAAFSGDCLFHPGTVVHLRDKCQSGSRIPRTKEIDGSVTLQQFVASLILLEPNHRLCNVHACAERSVECWMLPVQVRAHCPITHRNVAASWRAELQRAPEPHFRHPCECACENPGIVTESCTELWVSEKVLNE